MLELKPLNTSCDILKSGCVAVTMRGIFCLMLFKTFWLSMPLQDRLDFAQAAGSSYSTLNQLSSVGRPVGPALAVAIERATAGAVTRKDLRPSDWADIWPELIDKEAA